MRYNQKTVGHMGEHMGKMQPEVLSPLCPKRKTKPIHPTKNNKSQQFLKESSCILKNKPRSTGYV